MRMVTAPKIQQDRRYTKKITLSYTGRGERGGRGRWRKMRTRRKR